MHRKTWKNCDPSISCGRDIDRIIAIVIVLLPVTPSIVCFFFSLLDGLCLSVCVCLLRMPKGHLSVIWLEKQSHLKTEILGFKERKV